MQQSALDTSNFDTEFTSEVPVDSVADTSHLPADVQERFKGFTYKNHEAIAGSLAGSVANRMGTLTNRMDTLVVSHLPGGGLSSVNELNDERS